jgi:hypothetical protein
VIPNNLTTIGGYAFARSCLTNITIPGSVTSIGDHAFYDCGSLAAVTILDGVVSIGEEAFSDCPNLARISVPASVSSITIYAFDMCPNLTGVYFQGNAPGYVGEFAFDNSTNVNVYYLPGTTGWEATLDDQPTTIWLPQMQMTGTTFGGKTNQFGFNITWASDQTVVVDACTNLSQPVWEPVQTNTLATGSVYFNDPEWTNYPARYYRVRSP